MAGMAELPPASPTLFSRLAARLTQLLLWLFTRYHQSGAERVPATEPVLVVCNHASNVDPPIAVTAVPRYVDCMAKEELFHGPVGYLARWYGAFPVRRGQSDREAIRTALACLERGSAVLVFPEGTRNPSGVLLPGQAGVGLIAVRSGATIQPMALLGTERIHSAADLLQRHSVEIRFGEPFRLPPASGESRLQAAAAATDLIMRRIAALLPPERRGPYAEQPASQPTASAAAEAEVG